MVSHVGAGDNGIQFATKSFGFGKEAGWEDSKVEIFYDKTQTHIPKAGSRPAWDFKNNRQSISIYDPSYKEEDFQNIKKGFEGAYIGLNSDFFIAAGPGIDVNRLMYQIRQEKQREAEMAAEAEAKRIAEEKAAREKTEKERLEKERKEREEAAAKEKAEQEKQANQTTTTTNTGNNNSNSSSEKDTDPEPWENNPKPVKKNDKKDDGGNKTTQPITGSGENSTPPAASQPSQGGGNGGSGGGDSGGSKPNPSNPPGGGSGVIYTPCSIGAGNEYYLGSLYGTKPFSAQESSAFNSTIISNELSTLQPITSLNVAGLPVNDTAIKTEQFGA